MSFQEMLNEARKLKCIESRANLDYYFEIVVPRDGLDVVEGVLKSYFGVPLKPKGQPATPEIAGQAKPYGGIQANQTMYFHQGSTGGEFAFLWPWGDGTSITVKIMTEKK